MCPTAGGACDCACASREASRTAELRSPGGVTPGPGNKLATTTARSRCVGVEQDSLAAPSARVRLVAALTDAVATAVAAGDLHGARIAYDALGKLIAQPQPGVEPVADMAVQHGKRGQR